MVISGAFHTCQWSSQKAKESHHFLHGSQATLNSFISFLKNIFGSAAQYFGKYHSAWWGRRLLNTRNKASPFINSFISSIHSSFHLAFSFHLLHFCVCELFRLTTRDEVHVSRQHPQSLPPTLEVLSTFYKHLGGGQSDLQCQHGKNKKKKKADSGQTLTKQKWSWGKWGLLYKDILQELPGTWEIYDRVLV